MQRKNTWKTLAHSARGVRHQQEKMPCQDAGGILLTGQAIIGAVADGAGSAKKSEIGSQLAVEITKAELNKALGHILVHELLGFRLIWGEKKTRQIFERVLKANIKALNSKAKELKCPTEQLACTLIGFIITPRWTAIGQIGDGFVVIRRSEEEEYELVFPPEKGEFANQTYFITGKRAEAKMQVSVINSPLDFIFASTDGLEKMALSLVEKQAYAPFFKGIEKNFRLSVGKEWLKDWLENNKAVNQKTGDDKTVVIGAKIL
jgi:hypothetical protein